MNLLNLSCKREKSHQNMTIKDFVVLKWHTRSHLLSENGAQFDQPQYEKTITLFLRKQIKLIINIVGVVKSNPHMCEHSTI